MYAPFGTAAPWVRRTWDASNRPTQNNVGTSAATLDSGEIVRQFMDDALVKQDPEAVDNFFAESRSGVSCPPIVPQVPKGVRF